MFSLKRAISLATLVAAIPVASAQYVQVNLVSDLSVDAKHYDSNLVNPWGIASGPNGSIWVCDNAKGMASVYDAIGGHSFSSLTTPSAVLIGPHATPTGLVYNGGNGFPLSNGLSPKPSRFIFVTEDGVIAGWNPSDDLNHAVTAFDGGSGSSQSPVYKGAAMVTVPGGQSYLYVTNFREGMVDVFDSSWNMVGSFTDPAIPSNYSPFGIASFDGFLVVTYAQVDDARHDDVKGPGHGYVDIFNPRGAVLRRLIAGGPLNSPWGIALAPHRFGELGDALLIGNFGDGKINAFDPMTGAYVGTLRKGATAMPITIDGLWGLHFGNGVNAANRNYLYFTAGISGENHGLFGYIKMDTPSKVR